jgi:hypothetical protein
MARSHAWHQLQSTRVPGGALPAYVSYCRPSAEFGPCREAHKRLRRLLCRTDILPILRLRLLGLLFLLLLLFLLQLLLLLRMFLL